MDKSIVKGEEIFIVEEDERCSLTIPVGTVMKGKYKLTYTYKLEKIE